VRLTRVIKSPLWAQRRPGMALDHPKAARLG
jgi:hypothetical protein